ncbi:MAG TPA: hypothetical protein VHE83_02970, partial [Mycobacteriales bacterium]|nr:hypothetical protein [Mycobacteriales bacterium]
MSATGLAQQLWLVVGAAGVTTALRAGVPLTAASVPYALGAVGTGVWARHLPLPAAAVLAVAVAVAAGAAL